MPGSSGTEPLEGIREVFQSYKLQSSTPLESKADLGPVVHYLRKVFDRRSRRPVKGKECKELVKIRKVFKAYQSLTKWDPESASRSLIKYLEQVLGIPDTATSHQSSEPVQVKEETDNDDDDIEIVFCKLEAPKQQAIPNTATNPIPSSSSSKSPSFVEKEESKAMSSPSKASGSEIYTCPLCDKAYSNLPPLKHHLKYCRKPKPFVCKYCSKAFKFCNDLLTHERIHTGEDPYKCKYCKKSFSRQTCVTNHEKIHTELQNFECKRCHKTFTRRDQLEAHEKSPCC